MIVTFGDSKQQRYIIMEVIKETDEFNELVVETDGSGLISQSDLNNSILDYRPSFSQSSILSQDHNPGFDLNERLIAAFMDVY
jgi:hypothetical protein